MDACNRKLMWNRPNQPAMKHLGFKEFMCSAWSGRGPRSTRWVNIEQLNAAIKDEQNKQDGGIEGAEQSAFDRLLNSRDGLYDLFQARSRALRDGLSTSSFFHTSTSSKAASRKSTSGKSSQSEPSTNSEPEYDIDPITNRKVYRNPAASFKGYRAQFQPNSSEQIDPTRDILEESETQSYKPYFAYEPDGKIPTHEEEGLKDYDGGESYRPFFAYEPDGKKAEKPDPVQDGLKDFDTGESYKPYFAYEPDGKLPNPAQDGLNEHEATVSYKPFFACEAEGKMSDQAQDALKEYEAGVSYEPYFAYEPDGKIPHQVEEGLKEYETGVSYEPYFAYEPDGNMPDQVTKSSDSCPVQQGLKDHDNRTSYGAVRYREPDGKLPEEPCPVQKGLKAYDNITSYEPRPVNDPANNFDPAKSTLTGGLHDFCCRMTYGTTPRMGSSDHNGTSNGQSYSLRDKSDREEDLDLLRSSDVRAASGVLKSATKETEAEKLAKRKELEEQYQQLTIENSELQNVASHLKGRIDARIAEVSSELPPEGSRRDMTGNFVQDFPEEFEERWTMGTNGTKSLTPKPRVDAWGYDNTPQGLELSYEQEVQKSENEFIDGLASAESFASKPDVPRLQTSLERNAAVDTFDNPAHEVREIRARYRPDADSTEEIKLQNEMDPYSKEPQGLETHYAEEKRLDHEMDPYSKKPQGLETNFAEEQRLESRLENEMDPYSKEPQGLETHFETERRFENEKDPYSKMPQGLETSFAEECAAEADPLQEQETGRDNLATIAKQKDQELVREVRSIYEDAYGAIDAQHRQVTEAASTVKSADHRTPDAEPTMYTILAYDPTTQSVGTAETTSIIHDSAPALTPSEALLKLSNPAKFIPHFGSLQAAGYEIVSGSGDVLVWRKVRPSTPMSHLAHTKAMNPIDGMRSSPIAATGNFASPTGFVNHDLPDDSDHHTFKSNIDVRRVEDVFSGKPNWTDDAEVPKGRKMGRGKKMLIGAAWLGGLSYSVGVVAEYFKTGGIDGIGPQGF